MAPEAPGGRPLRQVLIALGCAALWIALATAGVSAASATLAVALGVLAAGAADGAARMRSGRSLLASTPASAAWAVVLSIFLMTAIERLNQARPVWTYLGWPRDELLRYLALGALHATALPLLIGVADAFGFFRKPARAISGKVALPLAVVGTVCIVAALREEVPAAPLVGFTGGMLGLLLLAEAWNGAAGDYRVTAAPAGPVAAGALWGALLWAGESASAQRFLIVDLPWWGWLLLSALVIGPTVLAAYRLAARKLGLPAYPSDEPEQETIGGLRLDR